MKFDGGIFLGRDPKTGDQFEVQNLASWSEAFDVSQSLFCDYQAIFDDMVDGNRRTLETARKNPQLIPLAVINPLHYDPSTRYLEELKSQGAQGFLFIPSLQYWSYQHYSFRVAAQKADKLRLPIQCVVSQVTDLHLIANALEFGKSPVLIRQSRGGGYCYLTEEIALGQNATHFYFDVSNLCHNGGIAHLANAIGTDRLYFASNTPSHIETSTHLLIQSAPDLSENQKSAILGKNLRKIFKVKDTKTSLSLPEKWKQVLDIPKIDTHWHTDGWDLLEPQKGVDHFGRYFDAFNEEAVLVSSIRALNYDIVEGNQTTFKEIEKDKRLYGLVVVDPLRIEESLKLIEKYKSHPRFAGLKTIQDYYGLDLDDERYHKILSWADEHQAVVMAHIPGLAKAAEKFPRAQFIAAHLTWDRLPKVLNSHGKVESNVWLDIATSHNIRHQTQLARLIKSVGVDRILYSVDGPLMSPAWTIGKLIDAELSHSDLRKIFYENALKLFSHLNLKVSSR